MIPSPTPPRVKYFQRKDTMSNLTEAVETFGDRASEVGEKAEELVRDAGKKLKDARNETVSGLHAAASSVRSTGHQGAAAIDNLAKNAASKLDATASCVENYDPLSGLRRFIHRHPGRSLVLATTIGFFAGCAVRQYTHSCGRRA